MNELKVNQEVEILVFGKVVFGVIKEIHETKYPQALPVKVAIKANNKRGYSITAKKAANVFPRGTHKVGANGKAIK